MVVVGGSGQLAEIGNNFFSYFISLIFLSIMILPFFNDTFYFINLVVLKVLSI